MAYSNDTITSPVSIYDVQQALGSTSTDLATLCKNPTISPWAKYKPIEYHNPNGTAYVDIITDNQRASVNWGMANIPIWRAPKTVAHVINCWAGTPSSSDAPECGLQSDYWTHAKPTTAYRLTDFVSKTSHSSMGYFTRAAAPITGVETENTTVDTTGLVSIVFGMHLDGIYSGQSLWYGNFSVMQNVSFANLYFGVMMKCGNQYYIATQSNTVGNLGGTSGNTLWEQGAHTRFLVGSSSGNILTYIQDGTPITMFPIMTSLSKNYESSFIAPIGGTTQGTFIALHPAEDVVIVGRIIIYGEVVLFNAWKDNTSSPRKNNRICYQLRVVANDNKTHRFNVTLKAVDTNGSQVGNSTQALNVESPYHPVATESGYISPFFDLNYSNSGVRAVTLVVSRGNNDTTPSDNWREISVTTPISMPPSGPTPWD